ncbi:ATP-grasp domain-containing protein [Spirillospora sp. NPDC029432]|uniref:ATP-grasp domain-containing protein n=1 Tax=Spirillospora sp. NPDC029432 TaxID=3154599 RepID=UPI003454CF25
MSDRRHVVLVDTYTPTRLLAPRFRALGYRCVRVQSTPEPPPLFASDQVRHDDYVASVVHDGDVAATVEAVAAFDPVAVVPGGEVGVEFCDLLSERLGTPTANGTSLSAARRDKHTMVETIKRAGLRGARQLRVADADELADWHRDLGGRVVIKPLRSAGGDGVSFCDTPAESVRAYRALLGSRDIFAGRNDSVVAQEYLPGTEYMVNTVSRDGRHHVCDIWKTTRINANGITDLCDALRLIASDEKEVPALTAYAGRVLDALGIRHGPAHVEIRMTPDGPCLVEVGARIAGGDIPYYASLGIGESQIDWTVDAYVRPERFHERCGRPYEVRRFCAMVAMVSPYEGTLREYRGAEEIRALESLHDMKLLVKPQGRLRRTVDDLSYPVIVTLMDPSDEVVARDIGTIRYLDGPGFYDVEPEPARAGHAGACTW